MDMNILRNYLMGNVVWAPDDKGNPTQAERNAEERKKINVTTNGAENDKSSDAEGETSDEETDTETTEEDSEENKDDAETEEEDKEEASEETETEEAETETVDAKAVAKLQKTIERLQRRIDKKTGSESELRKELKAAKEALEAKQAAGEAVLTEEEVNTRAKKLADEQLTAREFTRACNKLLDEAIKVDKKFESKIKDLAEEIGEIPSQMIGILDDLDNGGAVLAHLADPMQADLAEEIWGLPLAKQTLKLVKLSDKLEAEAKAKKVKKVSKVPAPNEPIGGRAAQATFDPRNTKISDKEWIEQRNRQVAERKASQRAALR